MDCLSNHQSRRSRQGSIANNASTSLDDMSCVYHRKQSFRFQFENMLRRVSNIPPKDVKPPSEFRPVTPSIRHKNIETPASTTRTRQSLNLDSCLDEMAISCGPPSPKPGSNDSPSSSRQRVYASPSFSDIADESLCSKNVHIDQPRENGSCRDYTNTEEAKYKQELAESVSRLGRFHRESIKCMENLARCHQSHGEWLLSENCYNDCLEAREMIHGFESMEAIAIVGSLAFVLRAQGKFERSIKLCRRALDARGKVLGMEHISTLKTAHNFALCLEECGEFVEAESLHIRATLGFENTLGSLNANTLKATNNLARIFHLRSKLPEAESLYCRLLRSKINAFGQNDLRTLSTCVTLATVLEDSGKIQGARDLYKCALLGYAHGLGPTHDRTQKVFAALCEMLANRKTLLNDDIDFYERVQDINPEAEPPDCMDKLLQAMTAPRVQGRKPATSTV